MKYNFYAKESPEDMLLGNFLFHEEIAFPGKRFQNRKGKLFQAKISAKKLPSNFLIWETSSSMLFWDKEENRRKSDVQGKHRA